MNFSHCYLNANDVVENVYPCGHPDPLHYTRANDILFICPIPFFNFPVFFFFTFHENARHRVSGNKNVNEDTIDIGRGHFRFSGYLTIDFDEL